MTKITKLKHTIFTTGIVDEKIYRTTRTYNESIEKDQFFRKLGGFGISLEVLNYLKEHNINTIIIRHIAKTGTYFYKSNPDDYLKFGTDYMHNSKFYADVKNDMQKILHISKFIKLSEEELRDETNRYYNDGR